jgi:hypothetical protein
LLHNNLQTYKFSFPNVTLNVKVFQGRFQTDLYISFIARRVLPWTASRLDDFWVPATEAVAQHTNSLCTHKETVYFCSSNELFAAFITN